MLIRNIRPEEKDLYNRVVNHPIQSYEGGEFRQKLVKKLNALVFLMLVN